MKDATVLTLNAMWGVTVLITVGLCLGYNGTLLNIGVVILALGGGIKLKEVLDSYGGDRSRRGSGGSD
jgi:hypothetical protein